MNLSEFVDIFKLNGFAGVALWAVIYGGLVWAVAALLARFLGISHWMAKLGLIGLSWMFWACCTFLFWTYLGGNTGEGDVVWTMLTFLVFVTLFTPSIFGAILVAIIWLLLGRRKSGVANG